LHTIHLADPPSCAHGDERDRVQPRTGLRVRARRAARKQHRSNTRAGEYQCGGRGDRGTPSPHANEPWRRSERWILAQDRLLELL